MSSPFRGSPRGPLVVLVVLSMLFPLALRADTPAGAAGLRADLLAWIDDAAKKLDELAEATPASAYTWRPGEGVRSQSEVFLHVASSNYRIPSLWGVAPPEGFKSEGYEQSITGKEEIRAALAQSFEHVKAALKATPDEDFDKPAKIFGNDVTVRWGWLLVVSHAHEHLGQSIAYARTNGVVPPWTARQQAAAKQKSAQGK
jgi:uncharacterized damage-inducible protein DinB